MPLRKIRGGDIVSLYRNIVGYRNTVVQGCHDYNTKVLTSEGYIPIGELEERYAKGENIPEKVWTGENWAEYLPMYRGEKELYKVITNSGRNAVCDLTHKFKVVIDDGYKWKSLEELNVGDKLAISQNSVDIDSRKYNDHKYVGENNFEVKSDGYETLYWEDEIINIEKLNRKEPVYTLSVVDEKHQYMVESGFISKNCGADIMKIALLKVYRNVLTNSKYKDDIEFISTVHDEANFSVRKSRMEEIIPLLMQNMELSIPGWKVDMECDFEVGNNWGHMFEFKYENGVFKPKMERVDN